MVHLLIRLEHQRQALRREMWTSAGGSSLLAIGVFHIFASLFFMPPMAVAGWIMIGLGILLLFTIVLAPVSWSCSRMSCIPVPIPKLDSVLSQTAQSRKLDEGAHKVRQEVGTGAHHAEPGG